MADDSDNVVFPPPLQPSYPRTLDPNPALDDALILRLQYDLAAKIHPRATIAQRYGFNGIGGLLNYLSSHPQIVENVKKTRAIIESDEGSEGRVRLKALHATEALIPAAAGIAMDPRIAPQQRIDAFKQLSRVAAVDGSAAAAMAKAGSGAAFTLNILFRDNPEKLSFVADAHPDVGSAAGSAGPGGIGITTSSTGWRGGGAPDADEEDEEV
jgi:hypothetical protein